MSTEEINWVVNFAYSGSSKRNFLVKRFHLKNGEDINKAIKNYVYKQNIGSLKSDKIRYFSKLKLIS